jgi:hypothetical protein
MTGGRAAPNQARHIINLLGGRKPAERVLGWPRTKVDSAIRAGFIRCQDQRHVLERAWDAGIHINPADFIVHLDGLTRRITTDA